jgi:hypothetical protein
MKQEHIDAACRRATEIWDRACTANHFEHYDDVRVHLRELEKLFSFWGGIGPNFRIARRHSEDIVEVSILPDGGAVWFGLQSSQFSALWLCLLASISDNTGGAFDDVEANFPVRPQIVVEGEPVIFDLSDTKLFVLFVDDKFLDEAYHSHLVENIAPLISPARLLVMPESLRSRFSEVNLKPAGG